ncbi:MAG: 50S ribosomal protein L35 [Candidatus Moranbacteria bacterium]|nr:50S ribosomal protein L35 [Candidatus Moranbacteria bacterium]
MPKLKTRKAVAKRFKTTSTGKVVRRQSNQNHFNARQTPKQKRAKRGSQIVAGKIGESIKRDLLK